MKKLLLLFVSILIIGFQSCNSKKENSHTRKDILIERAKKDALQRLKSPTTTKFIDSTASILKLKGGEDNSWRVNISIDTQNGFGAMTRKRITAIYEFKGGDSLKTENYKLSNFW